MIKRLFIVLSIVSSIAVIILLVIKFGADTVVNGVMCCFMGTIGLALLASVWNYIMHNKFQPYVSKR